MAGCAVIHDAGMVEHRWCKSAAGHMAHITVLCCGYMIRPGALAGGIDAVVTGVTPFAGHIGTTVVDKSIEEAARVMAHGAVTTGITVYRGIRFAYCTQRYMVWTAVMAGDAVSGDSGMRKIRGFEHVRRMTNLAVLQRRQVAGRLDQLGPVRNETLVMTALTTTGNARVNRREERCRREHTR